MLRTGDASAAAGFISATRKSSATPRVSFPKLEQVKDEGFVADDEAFAGEFEAARDCAVVNCRAKKLCWRPAVTEAIKRCAPADFSFCL
jgi:hypothetical protein